MTALTTLEGKPIRVGDSFPTMAEERRLTAGGWERGDGYDHGFVHGNYWRRVTASGRKQTLHANGKQDGVLANDGSSYIGQFYDFTVTDSLDTAYDPHAFEEKVETFEAAMNWADSQAM